MTLLEIAQRVDGARTPEDLFGPLAGDIDEQRRIVGITYRSWSKIAHPDLHAGADFELADRIFRRLTEFKDLALRKIDAGRYGMPDVPVPERRPDVVIEFGKRQYRLGPQLCAGDYADLYPCTWSGFDRLGDGVGLLKLTRSAADNDLAEHEAKIMKTLWAEESRYSQYFARLFEAFAIKNKSQSRRTLVMERFDDCVTLEFIIARCLDGLDFRDAAWMFKRMLAGLGYAHSIGIVHGGITPAHVMVHPVNHGARILDWSAASQGAPVKYASKRYRAIYAPEILDKKPPTPATDIFMAAQCAVSLMRGQSKHLPIPTAIRRFFDGCLFVNPSRRPQDAWALHEEFDELLLKVVGPRKYRPLRIPGMAF